MDKKKLITLQVTGNTNSGKSRLAYALKEFLKEEGFEVEVLDSDFPTEASFNQMMRNHIREALESIKSKVKVKLNFSKGSHKFSIPSTTLKVYDKLLERQERIEQILEK